MSKGVKILAIAVVAAAGLGCDSSRGTGDVKADLGSSLSAPLVSSDHVGVVTAPALKLSSDATQLSPMGPVTAPSGALHPGHWANKVVTKASAFRATGSPPLPKVDPVYLNKQQLFLQRWDQLSQSTAQLPAEELAARRAAFKRETLGD